MLRISLASCPTLTPREDQNRDFVIANGYLSVVIRELEQSTLLSVVIPVLYNILNDYGTLAPLNRVPNGLMLPQSPLMRQLDPKICSIASYECFRLKTSP